MNILEKKCTVTEIKNSLEMLNSTLELAEDSNSLLAIPENNKNLQEKTLAPTDSKITQFSFVPLNKINIITLLNLQYTEMQYI